MLFGAVCVVCVVCVYIYMFVVHPLKCYRRLMGQYTLSIIHIYSSQTQSRSYRDPRLLRCLRQTDAALTGQISSRV